MSKKPTFIEIEDFLIKRSLIQSVKVREYDYDEWYLVITYYNGLEIMSFETKVHSKNYIKEMYNEIKEVLL